MNARFGRRRPNAQSGRAEERDAAVRIIFKI